MSFKIKDFECLSCENKFEYMVNTKYFEEIMCPECNNLEHKEVHSFAGYKIAGNNTASVTPKNAGSFKRSKNGKTKI